MDVITGLCKVRGKIRITVNMEREINVPLSLFRERPLSDGQPLDLKEYEQWLMVRQYRHALDRAVSCLAVRARSKKEIESKLLQSGYLPNTIEMVIYKLSKEGLLDDEAFARQWVQVRTQRSQGKGKIAQELYRKGIEKDTAETALDSLEEDQQLQSAKAVCEKWRTRHPNDDPKAMTQKLMQALVRRGFGWDIVKKAVNSAEYDE